MGSSEQLFGNRFRMTFLTNALQTQADVIQKQMRHIMYHPGGLTRVPAVNHCHHGLTPLSWGNAHKTHQVTAWSVWCTARTDEEFLSTQTFAAGTVQLFNASAVRALWGLAGTSIWRHGQCHATHFLLTCRLLLLLFIYFYRFVVVVVVVLSIARSPRLSTMRQKSKTRMTASVLKLDPYIKGWKRRYLFGRNTMSLFCAIWALRHACITSHHFTSLSCQHSSKHWTQLTSKTISGLALHLIFFFFFHHFSPVNCCWKCRFVAW